MDNLSALTSTQLKRAADIKDKIESLTRQLNSILGTPAAAAARPSKKGQMSAAGRAKVAAAQRARWAKIKAGKATVKAPKPAGKRKFTMSPAAKAKISAAAKARWARFRAARKS